jgi:membrane dipeptidase
MSSGKIAGFIGLEGCVHNGSPATILTPPSGHQLGNSLAVLRQYYALGVRYLTLTHLCHNAFADSGGFLTAPPPLHYGLSPLGMELVREMNRCVSPIFQPTH